MKIPLIIITLAAIVALTAAFIFLMQKRMAQQRAASLAKQLNDAKAQLAKAESFGKENASARNFLLDYSDALKK